MALIKCPECGKEISDKAISCPNCGCPNSEFHVSEDNNVSNKNNNKEKSRIYTVQKETTEKEDIILEICQKYSDNEKSKAIKELVERTEYDKKEAAEIINGYWKSKERVMIKHKSYVTPAREFNGVYKHSILFGNIEVRCPRCGSEDCSHYQEQQYIPGKTKSSYSINLNPLKPFTFANKKEKVVKKDKLVTNEKYLCNTCGKIFS